MDNETVALRLLAHARSLRGRDGNLYRQRAYRRAAEVIMRLEYTVAALVEEQGRSGLAALPGIGAHLAYTIEGLVRTGEFRTVNGEDGNAAAECFFLAER